MKIEPVRVERTGSRSRIASRIVWEDCERPPLDLYFETDNGAGNGLFPHANPFLIAAATPAFRHREQRIQVTDTVSPELVQGLNTVMSWMRRWFRPHHSLPKLEVRPEPSPLRMKPERRAGSFFSGGVDSLATLRWNRVHFPASHPGSIREGLLVFGLEIETDEAFALALEANRALAADADLALVPIFTNIRRLDEDWDFYRNEFQGAILAAIAHALAGRLRSISIAATYDIANLGPWGSHPAIDTNFSTHRLTVHHDGVWLSRLDKLKLLLDWPTALKRMRVCNETAGYNSEALNCGRCEKCVRTILELMALGAFDRADAFQKRDLSESFVATTYIHDDYVASCYRDLVGPLRTGGLHDLSRGVESALARYSGEVGLRGRLKRFDREYLNGALRALRKAARRTVKTVSANGSSRPPLWQLGALQSILECCIL